MAAEYCCRIVDANGNVLGYERRPLTPVQMAQWAALQSGEVIAGEKAEIYAQAAGGTVPSGWPLVQAAASSGSSSSGSAAKWGTFGNGNVITIPADGNSGIVVVPIDASGAGTLAGAWTWNNTTNTSRMTCVTAGQYRIHVQIRFGANTFVVLNGTTCISKAAIAGGPSPAAFPAGGYPAANTPDSGDNCNHFITRNFAANDYLEVYAYNPSSAQRIRVYTVITTI